MSQSTPKPVDTNAETSKETCILTTRVDVYTAERFKKECIQRNVSISEALYTLIKMWFYDYVDKGK